MALACGQSAELPLDELSQFMHVHPGGINCDISQLPHGLQQRAFQPDSLAHRQVAPQGVRAARLFEAADQGLVGGLQEHQ